MGVRSAQRTDRCRGAPTVVAVGSSRPARVRHVHPSARPLGLCTTFPLPSLSLCRACWLSSWRFGPLSPCLHLLPSHRTHRPAGLLRLVDGPVHFRRVARTSSGVRHRASPGRAAPPRFTLGDVLVCRLSPCADGVAARWTGHPPVLTAFHRCMPAGVDRRCVGAPVAVQRHVASAAALCWRPGLRLVPRAP